MLSVEGEVVELVNKAGRKNQRLVTVCACRMGMNGKIMDTLWLFNIAMENHNF
jgi:hypothetical protein